MALKLRDLHKLHSDINWQQYVYFCTLIAEPANSSSATPPPRSRHDPPENVPRELPLGPLGPGPGKFGFSTGAPSSGLTRRSPDLSSADFAAACNSARFRPRSEVSCGSAPEVPAPCLTP